MKLMVTTIAVGKQQDQTNEETGAVEKVTITNLVHGVITDDSGEQVGACVFLASVGEYSEGEYNIVLE